MSDVLTPSEPVSVDVTEQVVLLTEVTVPEIVIEYVQVDDAAVVDVILPSVPAIEAVTDRVQIIEVVGSLIGPVGPEGPLGPTGPVGSTGPTGPPGPQGADSTVPGPKGDTGATGAQGIQGEVGDVGPQGETGPIGPLGPQGPIGPIGPEGAKGDTGEQGAMGALGPQGPVGGMGPTGPEGPQGQPGQSYTTFEYMFDSATVEPPTSSEIRFNNSMHNLATKVWVHNLSSLGKDNANAFTLVNTGSRLFIQDKDDSTKWVSFDSTGPGVAKTNYYEFPVAWKDWGPNPLAQQRVMLNIATKGLPGDPGIQGPPGPPGADSTIPGPVGPKGDKGDTGDTGATGATGPTGPGIAEAPVDGAQYARKNATWSVVVIPPSGIAEAPNDGAAYGRLSNAWAKTVKLAGDTLTGPLTLSIAGTANQVWYVPDAPAGSRTSSIFSNTTGKFYMTVLDDVGASTAGLYVERGTSRVYDFATNKKFLIDGEGGSGTLATMDWTCDDTAPSAPIPGDRWMKPATGEEMVWTPATGGGGAWLNPAVAGQIPLPLSVAQGGTGATTTPVALTNLTIPNHDKIVVDSAGATALSGFLTVAVGGSGANSYLDATAAPLNKRIAAFSQDVQGVLRIGHLNDAKDTWLGGIQVQADHKTYDLMTGKAFVTTAGGTLDALTVNSQLNATAFNLDADTGWYQTTDYCVFQMATNWSWNYTKATGDLRWWRGGLYPFVLASAGDVYTGGSYLFLGDGTNLALYSISNGDRALRFTSDGWRWNWNAGNLAYYNNSGANLFSIDGGGQAWAANNYNAAGAGGAGLTCTGYQTSGGSYYRNVVACNPNWNTFYFQATHAGGQWAGWTMWGPSQQIQFTLSGGGGWGAINAQAFTVQSDERGKERIKLLSHQRDSYMKIRPIEWHWPPPNESAINPDLRPKWGFSAQNLTQSVPLAVMGDTTKVDDEGKPVTAGIDPVPILALTVLEVQDLIRRIEALENA